MTIHINGQQTIDILIAEAAQFEQELMKSDQVTLSWNSDENTVIPVGAYIEYKGEKYSLLDPYTPVQKNEVEWAYTPVFKSEIMRWGKVPFFFYTYNTDNAITGRETDWVLTDTPANFMAKVCESIKNETGALWTYSVDASLAASMTITFSSVDIFSALNSIANAFETEWWVDKTNKVLHLSKASFGDAVTLEVDVNIGVPTVQSQNGKEYYNRFYAFGSTRNIPQEYSGANVNNLTNKRLTLDPAVYPGGYKDTVEGLTPQTALSKILVFDEIYPHSDLEISDVRARLRYVLDESGNKVQVGTDDDGNPVYDQYTIWYFKIAGFTFNNTTYDEESNPNGMLLPGLTLSVHFRSGALTGREFELAYHDAEEVKNDSADVTPFTVEAGDYEILYVKEGSYIIPAQTGIVPADGDDVTLFNIKMPDSYNATAYEELEDALDEAIAEYASDLNSYTSKSNPVAFNTSDPGLVVGRNVTYKNGSYTLSTRVTKIIKKLDYECEQTITFGNSVVKGSTQELKEDVVLANRNIDILTQLNQLSNQLTQSYNRVQQSMIEGFARIGNMWKFDPDDPDNTIYTPFNVYSNKEISAGGKSSGGGGGTGGLIQTVYGYSSLGGTFSDNNKNDTFNAYTINTLASRIGVLENTPSGIASLTVNLGTVSYVGTGTTDVTVNLPAYYSAADSDNRYLQLSGGAMSGDITMTGHALVWDDQTAYDNVPTGLMGVSVVNDSELGYSTAISFKNYYGLQIAMHGAGTHFYVRGHNHTQWKSWYELLHTGNIGSYALTPSNYTSTLDGRYVKKSGDTMTGSLISSANYIVYGGFGFIKRMQKDTSNYESALAWTNATGTTYLATIGYFNANKRIYINSDYPNHLSVYDDAVGKYNLIIGQNELTYNTYPLLHTNNYASYLDSRYARTTADNNLINHTNEFNFIPSNYNNSIAINYRTQGGSNGNVSEYRFYNGSGQLSNILASTVTANAVLNTPSVQVYDNISTKANRLSLNWNGSYARVYAASNDGGSPRTLWIGSTSAARTLCYDSTTGRWGLGTVSPTLFFHISGAIRCDNWIYSYGPVGWYNGTYGGGWHMTDSNYVRVYNSKAVMIDGGVSNGPRGYSVGLKIKGTDGRALELIGGNYTFGIGAHSDGNVYWWRGTANPDSSTNKSYVMIYNGTTWAFTGNISATGEVSAGNASDRRLKKDISTLSECETKHVLSALNPVSFVWNAKAEELSNGRKRGIAYSFVADEFLSLLPNAGRKMWDEYDAIYTEQVVPYVVKGWQMHERRLSDHERRIQELEKENKELKRQLRRVA